MVRYVIIAFVIIAALSKIGVETTSFVAIIGAAGLAVGLALQGSLSNFASGVLIIALRPFKAGEYIEAAGTGGVVESVQIFSTTLTTADNKYVVVPNSSILSGNIVNYSRKPTRRIDLVVGVSYSADLAKTKAVLEAVLAANSKILPTPAPQIAVAELADSSVNLVVRPWVNGGDYWPVRFELMEAIKNGLDEAGIEIPFPQMVISKL
jgi:small conductance mechanosensitive channel